MKITILEPLGVLKEKIEGIAKPLMEDGHVLEVFEEKTNDIEELKSRVKDTDILVIANSPLNGEVIKSAKKLKMISVAFTGVDHVDLKACKENNILVSNAAGYSTESVAELAFGLIISLLRNVLPLDKKTRQGFTKEGYRQQDLNGKTLGIIGTGAIGKKVADIGLAFGCNVIAYSRSENQDLKDKGVRYLGLDEVMGESDIVSVHLPLNDKTKGIIDDHKIGLMKNDAFLINVARGPIIDNKALAKALNDKKIAGAGLDVFDMEPPIPEDYELLQVDNTILTPHIAYATEEAMVRRAEIVFNNIEAWLKDEPINMVE